MPSQKSSGAVAPKRERGRARVEALLDAASIVFGERGYDQATMTEIAARSATAIGSLYRFFPTKEALGETLLQRFMERSAAELDPKTSVWLTELRPDHCVVEGVQVYAVGIACEKIRRAAQGP